jgi:H/ACA ribonucleoprotein complex subunit 2
MSDTEKTPKKSSSLSSTVTKSYEERIGAINAIAKPLTSKKSTKKAHKLVKKASSAKIIRRGVKEVVKAIRKNETGICILAGDIYPLDVISHLPVLLEENGIPYIFVPSKQDLGAAACTKRPTSVVLIRDPATAKSKKEFEGMDLYKTLIGEAKEYDPSDV